MILNLTKINRTVLYLVFKAAMKGNTEKSLFKISRFLSSASCLRKNIIISKTFFYLTNYCSIYLFK